MNSRCFTVVERVFTIFLVIIIYIFSVTHYPSIFDFLMSQDARLKRSSSLYDLDYKAFHETGEKKLKEVMEIDRLKIREKQIRTEINHNLNLYNLDELDTADDVIEGLDIINDLNKSLIHIHVELEMRLGDVEYSTVFPKVRETKDKVRDYLIKAKGLSKRLKEDEDRKKREEYAEERRAEEISAKKTSLAVQIEVFDSKIDSEIRNFPLNDVDDIESSCRRFEVLLDECYNLLGQAKILFAEFDIRFKDVFIAFEAKIRGQIEAGKDKISKLVLSELDTQKKMKAKEEKLSKDKFVKEQTSIAEILADEIKLRSKSVVSKCQLTALRSSNDYELLDRGKRVGEIDSEMRELLDKFSEISKIAVSVGPSGDALLRDPRTHQDEALKARNDYAQELYSLV